MKTPFSPVVGRTLLVAGIVLPAAPLPAQNLYTFDNLAPGALQGRDNWVASERAVIEAGTGVNPSPVFNNNTNDLPQATASRVNDTGFSFPALGFGLTNAVLGFDFRVADAAGSNSSADFLLAHRDHGFTDQGKIGIRYNSKYRQLMLMRADGAGYAGSTSNYMDAPGDWFRARLVVDFTKYGANGSGSLYVRNLTKGDEVYSPVTYLQNVSLLILNQGADPAGWDRMDARACNAQVDNLLVGFTTNTAPVLAPLPNRSVPEGSLLTFAAAASDADLPAQAMQFSLTPGSPAGANISSDGVFSWTPTEAQGPGVYFIGVKVTDSGLPPMSATNRITVTVQEMNTPPALSLPADQIVNEGSPLSYQITASDPDLPAQTLTYSLQPGAPTGLSLTAEGVLSWTPSQGYWPATNQIQVVVTDNGIPPLSVTQSFMVVVNHLPVPASPVLVRAATETIKVRLEALLGSDPDGDALSLASLNPVGAGGGGATTNEGWAIFSPSVGPPNDDAFSYTVADARGAIRAGMVTVRVAPCLQPGLDVTWESPAILQVRLRGNGVALRTYSVEFTENLASPIWQGAGTVVANEAGAFEFLDHVSAGPPVRFYRTICP
ncbi:MAG TPA: putative Ig domain-containing protein [Verrucomicrobiae bacterium]